jgi:hypothetical protein
MNGRVTQWNDAIGQGMIAGQNGSLAFTRAHCTAALQSALAGHAIPPGKQVPVTYDEDPVGGEAVNVDLA